MCSRSPDGWFLDVGANLKDAEVEFRVWAPFARKVQVALLSDRKGWRRIPMEGEADGFYATRVRAAAGARYMYALDGKGRRPDPVSRFQPDGVHGPSEVVRHDGYDWTDRRWKGLRLEDLIIYEVHVGTYTPEGTFVALSRYLDYLKRELGVTAIELMPVGQFPGDRNWGYDGVCIYAPQNSYGGPTGLKRLVDDCHRKGLAVLLDVVYNHLGPEGNYLGDFGPYFSSRYKTPWGPAMNYDDRGCDRVRRFVVNNALYWISEYHFDGLRLDAVHGIFDSSPRNIMLEIADAVHAQEAVLGRKLHVIAESNLNDPKIISSKRVGGYNLDAQWSDDFHHSVHAFLTGERFRYYQDFGGIMDIQKALRDGFVYDGRYSRFRGKTHGADSSGLPGERFVVFLQNHDQVGNRPDGLRLSSLLATPLLKVAVGLLILAPNIPLLFMGEEFGETAPFHYFVSHTEHKLVGAVREGRRRELALDGARDSFADPQDPSTFEESKVNHGLLARKRRLALLRHYRELIEIRKTHPALSKMNRRCMEIRTFEEKKAMLVRRWEPGVEELLLVYVLGPTAARLDQISRGRWTRIFDSTASDRHRQLVPTKQIEQGTDVAMFPPYSLTIYSNAE